MLDQEGSKRRRANNRAGSAQFLRARNFQFKSKNNGAHLVVTQGDLVVDFWPGTGLWIVRGTGVRARGVKRLMGFLRDKG